MASAGATRPPSSRAAATATAVATTMPATPAGIFCTASTPRSASHAQVLAKVATSTQPKYRPKAPSVSTCSTTPPVRGAPRMYMIRMSTASRARMTTTEPMSEPSCTVQIQAALSSRDSSAQGRRERCRGEVRAVRVSCQRA